MRGLFFLFNEKTPAMPTDIALDAQRVWSVLDQDSDLKRDTILTLALCDACAKGDQTLGEYLLFREKAPVNGVIGLVDAPLYSAIDAQQADMVRLLIKYGVRKNPWDLDKHSGNMNDEIRDLLKDTPLESEFTP
jgi:hypothetical protein